MVAGKLVKFATLIAGAGSIVSLANCGSPSDQGSDETTAAAEVWFSSNSGTSDLLDLFTQLERWPAARQNIDVFSFSMGQIVAGDFCGWCNANVFSGFVGVDAFDKLGQWGIDIAIESVYYYPYLGATISAEECATGQWAVDKAFTDISAAINNIQRYGGTVRYLAMDEPIRKWYPGYAYFHTIGLGKAPCLYDTLGELAADVASYISRVNAVWPDIGIGQIGLYPEAGVEQIVEWVTELESRGVYLPFFHLDVHMARLLQYQGWGLPVDVTTDLRELASFFADHDIAFGVIFIDMEWNKRVWAPGEYTDETYFDGVMDWLATVKTAIGEPDHSVFMSWIDPTFTFDKTIPINLPEDDPSIYSHTRLINEGLEFLRNQ